MKDILSTSVPPDKSPLRNETEVFFGIGDLSALLLQIQRAECVNWMSGDHRAVCRNASHLLYVNVTFCQKRISFIYSKSYFLLNMRVIARQSKQTKDGTFHL